MAGIGRCFLRPPRFPLGGLRMPALLMVVHTTSDSLLLYCRVVVLLMAIHIRSEHVACNNGVIAWVHVLRHTLSSNIIAPLWAGAILLITPIVSDTPPALPGPHCSINSEEP